MDATEAQRTIVVSFSARAIVGLRLCLEHPERVEAAVFATPDLWPNGLLPPSPTRRDDADDFNFELMRSDWPGFLERWARRMYPNPHSTKQIEDFVSYGMDTDARPSSPASWDSVFRLAMRRWRWRAGLPCRRWCSRTAAGRLAPKDASGHLANAIGAAPARVRGPRPCGRLPLAGGLQPRRPRVRGGCAGRGGRAAGRYAQLTGFACRGSSAFRMIWTTTGSNASATCSERSVGQTSCSMWLVAFGA